MDATNASHDVPPYTLSGGKASPRRKSPSRKSKAKASPKKAKAPAKIYVGPNGGKYYLRKGRKVYI